MTARSFPVVAAGVLAAALLGACGSTTSTASSTSAPASTGATASATLTGAAATTHLREPWVKAVDSGMTAMFGTLENTGSTDVNLVSVTTPASTMVQLHETVGDGAGGTKMQEKSGGFVVKAGQEFVLKPGGNHLMFMGITGPLKAGTTVTVVLTFSDGSTLPVTAEVRTFSAAQESYAPGATTGTGGMSMGATQTHG
jgi:copper(I)-binding protein